MTIEKTADSGSNRQSEVKQLLDLVTSSIAEAYVCELQRQTEDRLTYVMREPEKRNVEAEGLPNAFACPLVTELRDIASTIMRLSYRMRETLELLEI